MLTSLEENGLNPISLGNNSELILSIVTIITTLFYMVVYFGGFVVTQLGASIQCWQKSSAETISRKKELSKAIFRKILPGLPGYLALIVISYLLFLSVTFCLAFLLGLLNEPVIFLLLLAFILVFLLFFYLGIYLVYIFIPVTSHEKITFKQRCKLAWLYLRSHFWDIFIYTLIVAFFEFVAHMIIMIPYVIIIIIIYIPTVMLMIQANINQLQIILLIYILILSILATIITALKNLIVSAKQTAFTGFYYQKYSESEEMQKIAPLSSPVLLEE